MYIETQFVYSDFTRFTYSLLFMTVSSADIKKCVLKSPTVIINVHLTFLG